MLTIHQRRAMRAAFRESVACKPEPSSGGGSGNGPMEWISLKQLTADTQKIVAQLPPNLSGVAGIPRSGMLVAPIIATLLHLPLFELGRDGQFRRLTNGSRGDLLGFAGDPAGPMLVVDDSVYSGWAIRRARQVVSSPALYVAVYVRPQHRGVVDFYGRLLPSPHLFEWHLYNSGLIAGHAADRRLRGGFAFDFDGVICEDPLEPDADEGPALDRYRAWLGNARPLYLPRKVPIPLIVSFRLERWRPETLAWLERWGVRCDRLVLHPAATASERNRNFDVAGHKGRAFRGSTCSIFLESDPRQCPAIFDEARKPVVCPGTGEVWQ